MYPRGRLSKVDSTRLMAEQLSNQDVSLCMNNVFETVNDMGG